MKTFGTSQLCKYLLTAVVLGSAPMQAPPIEDERRTGRTSF
jgi:hypothetical protein